MYECEKRVGRNDCKNCVLYDDEMGMCLHDIKPVEPKKENEKSCCANFDSFFKTAKKYSSYDLN